MLWKSVSPARTIRVTLQKVFLFLLVWSILPHPVLDAAPNDLHLHFLYRGRDLSNAANDERLLAQQQLSFGLLTAELGFALMSPLTSPAKTMGSAGFEVSFQLGVSDIPETSEHWRRAVEDERPDSSIAVSRIRFRKGLPFSFELEGDIGFLHNTSYFLAGLALKWSLNEGFVHFPDIAIRVAINRLFGSRDMELFTLVGDFILSKGFVIAEMFTLTPFVAYSFGWARGASNVLDPTPKIFDDNESIETGNFIFEPENQLMHRIQVGIQFNWYILNIALEGAVSLPAADREDPANPGQRIAPATIWTFNTKVALAF
ncbi:MAG: hypothetical protein AAGJ35_09730 [Myxococcota bacterium]